MKHLIAIAIFAVIIIAMSLIVGFVPEGERQAALDGREIGSQVILITNYGEVEIELLGSDAPNTVANFLRLSKGGFYNGTRFHRVIRGFMIQGGDPFTRDFPDDIARHGTGGPGYTFEDEKNQVLLEKGIVAMANAGPNTNGSQFFIVTAPIVDWLNVPGRGWHTPFAKVIRGMEVVEKIENVAVDQNDRPLEPVIVAEVIIK